MPNLSINKAIAIGVGIGIVVTGAAVGCVVLHEAPSQPHSWPGVVNRPWTRPSTRGVPVASRAAGRPRGRGRPSRGSAPSPVHGLDVGGFGCNNDMIIYNTSSGSVGAAYDDRDEIVANASINVWFYSTSRSGSGRRTATATATATAAASTTRQTTTFRWELGRGGLIVRRCIK